MKQLTDKEITKNLLRIMAWTPNKKRTEIQKTYKTRSFVDGLAFVAKIAVHAELLDHHPQVELSYSTVVVKLTTHDAQGLTKRDFELAERIDSIREA